MWNLLISSPYDEKKVAMVVTIAWDIWFNRNEVRNGGSKKTEMALVQWTIQYLEEYSATNEIPTTILMIQVVAWSPPISLRYKFNVDRAVFKAQKAAWVGLVIRDSHEQVVVALSKKISSPLGALEVEAKAFEAELQFAKDVGIFDFIIEGDSLVV